MHVKQTHIHVDYMYVVWFQKLRIKITKYISPSYHSGDSDHIMISECDINTSSLFHNEYSKHVQHIQNEFITDISLSVLPVPLIILHCGVVQYFRELQGKLKSLSQISA